MVSPINPVGCLRKIFLTALFFYGSEFCGKPLSPLQSGVLGYLIDTYLYVLIASSAHTSTLYALHRMGFREAKVTEDEEGDA